MIFVNCVIIELLRMWRRAEENEWKIEVLNVLLIYHFDKFTSLDKRYIVSLLRYDMQ